MRKRRLRGFVRLDTDFGLTEKEWLKLVRESKPTSTYHTSANNKRIER